MKYCFLAAVLVMLMAGCGASSASEPHPAGRASVGARLFVTDRCVQCHTVNGAGGNVGPDLTQDMIATDYGSLKSWLANPPVPQMQFVRKIHFTPQQIADLNAFTASGLKPAR